MKKILTTLILVLTIAVSFAFVGCGDDASFLTDDQIANGVQKIKTANGNDSSVITGTISLTSKNEIFDGETKNFNFELYYEKAPLTVTKFVSLVNDGFYDETTIYSLVQYGGDTGKGAVGIGGYTNSYDEDNVRKLVKKAEHSAILGEYKDNGWEKNDIKHETGVLTMDKYISSNFFITVGERYDLDGKMPAFGRLVSNENIIENLVENLTFDNGGTTTVEGTSGYVPNLEINVVSITFDKNYSL